MRRSTFVSSATALTAATAFPIPLRAASAVVRIGYIDSFSGPLSDIGAHHRVGVMAAIAETNKRSRTKFELVTGDDTSKPAVGSTEGRRLIGQENVDVLMGGTSSAVALALGPLAEEAGIFLLDIGGQDTSITGEKANRVAYRFAPNVQMQIRALSQRILSMGKKWYFIVDDFAYGKDGYARLSALLKRAGGSEMGVDILKLGTEDYSSALTKMRNTEADVLVLCQGGFDSAKTVKQFVDFGLHKKMHLGGLNLEDYYWKSIPQDELVGATFAIHWTPTVSDSAEKLARTLAKYTAGEGVSSRHYFGYICTMQMIDRMQAAGTTKADALVKAFHDHTFDAAKENKATWRGCDHQCVQDEYAGSIVSRKRQAKTGFMFDVVAQVSGTTGPGSCADTDAAAATAVMNAQKIPERTSYEPKPVS